MPIALLREFLQHSRQSVVSEPYTAHELSSELSLEMKERLHDQHRDRIVPSSQSSCANCKKASLPVLLSVGCVRRPDSDGQLWKLSKALLLLKDLH